VVNTLSLAEQQQLDQQEARIAHGLAKFYEVGAALLAIRDGRLYRATHPHFRAYCRDRWGISRPHAYRLMAAAEVVAQLSPLGGATPRSEGQARALARLDPRRLQEVWSELTAEGEQPTAAEIEEVIRRSGVAVPPAKKERLDRVRDAEVRAAREARRIGDRDRIVAGERAVRKALKLYEGMGGLGEAVCIKLREALAVSVQLVASAAVVFCLDVLPELTLPFLA
jgi:hypothetical protein